MRSEGLWCQLRSLRNKLQLFYGIIIYTFYYNNGIGLELGSMGV